MKNLEKIIKKYSEITYNSDNYNVGGGLVENKFASNRHENAKFDDGKLTLGKACQMFKKATDLELDLVKEIIKYAVPNMEWHHAGRLPKSYGGGMKKTYFLNSAEIVDIAENWDSYCEKLEISKVDERKELEEKRTTEEKRQKFLEENATRVVRIQNIPKYFYETNCEMNGKYGWFCSYGKYYNLPEYYTGWEFKSQELLDKFNQI